MCSGGLRATGAGKGTLSLSLFRSHLACLDSQALNEGLDCQTETNIPHSATCRSTETPGPICFLKFLSVHPAQGEGGCHTLDSRVGPKPPEFLWSQYPRGGWMVTLLSSSIPSPCPGSHAPPLQCSGAEDQPASACPVLLKGSPPVASPPTAPSMGLGSRWGSRAGPHRHPDLPNGRGAGAIPHLAGGMWTHRHCHSPTCCQCGPLPSH